MATKPLTDFIPTLYRGLDIVSREISGLIPASTINAAPTAVSIGEKIRIPQANKLQSETIVEGTQPAGAPPDLDNIDMTITKSKQVSIKWTGEEVLGVTNSGTYNTILADQFSQAYRVLVNEVESDLAAEGSLNASRAHVSAGSPFTGDKLTDIAMVRKILVDNGAPISNLQLVLNTLAGADLRVHHNIIKVNESGTDQTLRKGLLLKLMDFEIRESSQFKDHATGSLTGTPLTNLTEGFNPGATEIAFDGTSAIALKAGDIVSFGVDTDKYVITADAAASPLTIHKPGLLKTVANNVAVVVGPSYFPNLAFDKAALHLLVRTPAVPPSGDNADDRVVITDPVTGISFQVSYYKTYRQITYEISLAWGVKAIKPEHIALLC
jgi:hypothetical protein